MFALGVLGFAIKSSLVTPVYLLYQDFFRFAEGLDGGVAFGTRCRLYEFSADKPLICDARVYVLTTANIVSPISCGQAHSITTSFFS
jgi:hypothetical protein